MEHKTDIRKSSLGDLEEFFSSHGEKRFRARQVYEWLWKKSATSFSEMTNISLETRKLLEDHFKINHLSIKNEQKSSDGTVKSAFKLHDGHLIEGVLIPAEDRMTACVSSQVGCSLTCKFCATGYMKRERNLDPGEIYDQVVVIKKQAEKFYGQPLTNIVFMGMGEPLLNYKNVLEGIKLITSPDGLGISPKRITVSTAGIAKMIEKLADDEVKFRLALSLHAANEKKRSEIMPINEKNSLPALTKALKYFWEKTGNRVTLEYILFYNFNDTLEDAEELANFAHQFPCRINIIEYNPISEASFSNTEPDRLEKFQRYLEEKRRLNVNVRRSRGKDIDAACGQLAGKS